MVVTDSFDVKAYQFKKKGDARMAPSQYFKDIAVPTYLPMDDSK